MTISRRVSLLALLLCGFALYGNFSLVVAKKNGIFGVARKLKGCRNTSQTRYCSGRRLVEKNGLQTKAEKKLPPPPDPLNPPGPLDHTPTLKAPTVRPSTKAPSGKGKEKGKGKGKSDDDDVVDTGGVQEGTGPPSPSPSTSPGTTSLPSSSPRPPDTSPTTTSPKQSTTSPTATPPKPTAASPTTSEKQPTASPVVTSPPASSSPPASGKLSRFIEGTIETYACDIQVGDDYNDIQMQLVQAQARLCPLTGYSAQDLKEANVPQDLLAVEIIPFLVEIKLDCKLDEEYEFARVALDHTQDPGLASAGDGTPCLVWELQFRTDYYLQNIRRLAEATIINDNKLVNIVGTILNDAFKKTNASLPDDAYPGAESVQFSGLTNVDTGLGTGTLPKDDTGSGSNALQATDAQANEGSGIANALVVLAVVVVAAVIGAAVYIQKKRNIEKAPDVSHIVLKDLQDDEVETELAGGKHPLKPKVILALENGSDGDDMTMDDSLEVSHFSHPQVYIMGDGDDTTRNEESEVCLALSTHWVGARAVSPGPTFVTTDLKKAMKDLEPPRPTSQQPRGYIQNDTVDL